MKHLMMDIESPIIDFYPLDFHVDTIGKRYQWMGEVILPFIDQDRLK
jgi:5'-3' exoribonuclease 2